MPRVLQNASTRPDNVAPEGFDPAVVVGADGSPWGSAALGWAARYAWLRGEALTVYADAPLPGEPTAADQLATMQPLPVNIVESGGDPLRTLVPASEGADLVVLGCRGRQHTTIGLGRWVVPVVAAAHCDTVVVRGLDAAVHGLHSVITALVDGGESDRPVLRRAAELAATYHAKLHVAHAWPTPSGRQASPSGDAHGEVLDLAKDYLAAVNHQLSANFEAVRAQPYELVATRTHTDLIVVGSGGPGRLGSVTRDALHHALCPVLVVRP
jgi:nucleotide-binding universal stress UspA family protein